jgi:protein TonB
VLIEAVPIYRENRPPPYPSLARRRGYEGTVLLEVLVTEEGRVGELSVARSSGYKMLDRAALRAVRDWRFEPGTRGGRPMAMAVRIPVRFRLE